MKSSPYRAAPAMLLGLIGAGIMQSLTPFMHEEQARAHGLNCIYQCIDLDVLGLDAHSLAELLRAAELFGFTGLNITHPCKQAVLAHLDELSPAAAAIGAVNTVLLRAGRRIGHNTDYSGFRAALGLLLGQARPDKVVQLGAGGAGSAVAYALLQMGAAQLSIFDLDAGRAQHLAAKLARIFPQASVCAAQNLPQALRACDGVINATAVGMANHPGSPMPPELLEPRHWFMDIIYFPLETPLLRHARAQGCLAANGLDMAVYQAAHAFELFTDGRAANGAAMKAQLLSALENSQRAGRA